MRLTIRRLCSYRLPSVVQRSQTGFINRTLGGESIPKPRREGNIIIFPTTYAGRGAKRPEPEPEKPPVIEAPYGSPLPEGYTDYREALQRDGLILILWEKLTSEEGAFYNVLWAKSLEKRLTRWSGYIRE
jgi:hypothetical protein